MNFARRLGLLLIIVFSGLLLLLDIRHEGPATRPERYARNFVLFAFGVGIALWLA